MAREIVLLAWVQVLIDKMVYLVIQIGELPNQSYLVINGKGVWFVNQIKKEIELPLEVWMLW